MPCGPPAGFFKFVGRNHPCGRCPYAYYEEHCLEDTRKAGFKPWWAVLYAYFTGCTIAWWVWGEFAQVGLYSKMNCDQGCDPFNWPPTRDLVTNHDSYDETLWPNGSAFCYPLFPADLEGDGDISNEYEGSGENGPWTFNYEKPINFGGCRPSDICTDEQYYDPLILHVVPKSLFATIFGQQVCDDDECLYTRQDVLDAACEFNNLYIDSFTSWEWWGVCVLATTIQIVAEESAMYSVRPKICGQAVGQWGIMLFGWFVFPVFLCLFMATLLNKPFRETLAMSCFLTGEFVGQIRWLFLAPFFFKSAEKKKKRILKCDFETWCKRGGGPEVEEEMIPESKTPAPVAPQAWPGAIQPSRPIQAVQLAIQPAVQPAAQLPRQPLQTGKPAPVQQPVAATVARPQTVAAAVRPAVVQPVRYVVQPQRVVYQQVQYVQQQPRIVVANQNSNDDCVIL